MTFKIRLPQSPEDFDTLVARIVKKFKLKDAHHAAAIISIAIRHLPNEQAYTTLDYLGQYVMKNIANYVADHKGKLLKHEHQVNQLEQIITTDPTNQQAWDELRKAAGEGSTVALGALARLEQQSEPAKELN